VIRVKVDENNIFTFLTRGSWVVLALLTATGLVLVSARFAFAVATGGLIAIVNCHWLYSILQRAMGLPPRQAVRFAQGRYVLRLAIIAVIVSLLIIYGKIHVFGLLLGLSVVVVALAGLTAYMATLNGG
jgi:hypothetical protein